MISASVGMDLLRLERIETQHVPGPEAVDGAFSITFSGGYGTEEELRRESETVGGASWV